MSLRPCLARLFASTFAIQQRRVRSGVFKYRILALHGVQLHSRRTISNYQQARLERIITNLRQSCAELQEATKDMRADDIIVHWIQVRGILISLPDHLRKDLIESQLRMSVRNLVDASEVLAKRGSTRDAQALVEMLMDCSQLFKSRANIELLQNVLFGLVRAKQSVKAYDLLRAYRRYTTPGFRPNSAHFYTVMSGLRRAVDIERLKGCVQIMKSGWPYPNVTHYRQIVLALMSRYGSNGVPIAELKELLDEMDAMKLPYDAEIHEALKTRPELNGLAEQYSSRPRNVDKAVAQQWILDLQNARRKGRNPFQQKLKEVRGKGFLPDIYSLSKITDGTGVSTVEELAYLRELLEVEPNVVVWSVVIRNALNKRGVWDALELYKAARSSGICPDARMVHPILMRLCNGRFTEPLEKNVDRALELYVDLVSPQPERTPIKEESTSVSGADIAIYNTLLRALTSHSNKQKYIPRALLLLDDMQRGHLSMDAMTAASVAILLIRSASSYSAAYAAYCQVRALKGVILDAEAYAAILNAYCSLDFRDSFPSVQHYFAIVDDMQAAGIQKTEKIYTILLGRYASIATRLRELRHEQQRNSWQLLENLLAVIQDTHHQLTLDASITPDAPLWNQLMDAYNRVGYFKGVWDIWTILKSSGLVNNASVSVMLDACGFHGAYDEARTIVASLRSSGFPLNARNWNSWIECLARLGRLHEAVEAACVDMPKSVKSDESTVQILLSFANRAGLGEQTRSYIQRHAPDVWTRYKEYRTSVDVHSNKQPL